MKYRNRLEVQLLGINLATKHDAQVLRSNEVLPQMLHQKLMRATRSLVRWAELIHGCRDIWSCSN